jgi:outer membrane lipoprotein SlyB
MEHTVNPMRASLVRAMRSSIALPVAAGLLAACATHPTSSSVFTTGQAQQRQTVEFGTVASVRNVTIQPGQSGVGTVAGAALGGIAAGSNIGSGRGAIAAGVGGAVLGGMAGSAVESRMARRDGLEITVQLDNGPALAITQDADVQFREGERVRVLTGGGVTRVTR